MQHFRLGLFTLALAACAPDSSNQTTDREAEAEPSASAVQDVAEGEAIAPDALAAGGWGPLRIGMTRDEVVAALGPDANPGAVGGPEPEACDQFRPERAPEDMLVMIEDGKLTRISLVGDATVRTDAGLGLGATAAEVRTAYGSRLPSSAHVYQEPPAEYLTVWKVDRGDVYVRDPAARGIRYEIDGSGTVAAIHAGGPSIQYVEGCL